MVMPQITTPKKREEGRYPNADLAEGGLWCKDEELQPEDSDNHMLNKIWAPEVVLERRG